MLKYLKYYDNRGKDLQAMIEKIDGLRESIFSIVKIDELMGFEGNIRMNYYEAVENRLQEAITRQVYKISGYLLLDWKLMRKSLL